MNLWELDASERALLEEALNELKKAVPTTVDAAGESRNSGTEYEARIDALLSRLRSDSSTMSVPGLAEPALPASGFYGSKPMTVSQHVERVSSTLEARMSLGDGGGDPWFAHYRGRVARVLMNLRGRRMDESSRRRLVAAFARESMFLTQALGESRPTEDDFRDALEHIEAVLNREIPDDDDVIN